jgi:nitrous oxide reductase accessory protein NosL
MPSQTRLLRLAAAWIVVFSVAAVAELPASDGIGPQAGTQSLDGKGRMQISPADRCPVCGMRVIRYPKFAGAIQLQDNTTFYFCSSGCLIRSWMHPKIYLGITAAKLKRPVVKEYFSGRDVDGRDIIFVFGSDVIGPMGPALVPVMDENHLKVFKKRHGGRSHFRLNDMNDNRWFEMTGRKIDD